MIQHTPVNTNDILTEVRYEIRGELAHRAGELERMGYEIIQLNMHLTDEKRKIHELIRGSSAANLSQKSQHTTQHLSQRVNSKSDLHENSHIQ